MPDVATAAGVRLLDLNPLDGAERVARAGSPTG
jgi:hypothetical protein